jgi:tetratricopeptide (TPR) repeat protein
MNKSIANLFKTAGIFGFCITLSHNALANGAANDGVKEPFNDLTPSILYQVLAAEIAAQRGQLGTAAGTYLSLAKSTRDSRLAKRATEIFLGERALDGALQSAQLWAELAPTNEAANGTLEALYISSGKLSLVEPLLAKRLAAARSEKSLDTAYPVVERTLARAPDKRASYEMLERIGKPDQSVAAARAALATLASLAGLNDKAAEQSLAAFKLAPDSEAFAVNAAAYEQQHKQSPASAIAILKPFVERTPKAVEARITYGRLLAMDGQNAQAKAQLEQAFANDSSNPSVLYSLAQVSVQLKQIGQAKSYLDKFIALPRNIQRDNNAAFFFLGQLSVDEKDYQAANDWYSKIQRGEQYMAALTRRALVLGKSNRIAEARSLLQSVSPSTPRERLQLISAEASVLRQANQYEEVFTLLDSALSKAPNNGDLLYEQAMAAEKVNRLDVMEQSIKKLIQLEPTRADAYNALGYTLADRNLRLPEALGLIEKALTLAPNNGAILDSMGWVLFRMQKFPEAVDYLRRAFKITPDAEVAVHLGEALWRLGNKDEAIQMWRLAREKEPTNDVLKETLARLNVSI